VQRALIDGARLHESILTPLLEQSSGLALRALFHDAEQQRPQRRRCEPFAKRAASRFVEIGTLPVALVGVHCASMIVCRSRFENGSRRALLRSSFIDFLVSGDFRVSLSRRSRSTRRAGVSRG
jgi:hypothetical protein